MSWDYQRSLQRIQQHLNNMGGIEVSKLTREADLEQLLTETNCRDIYGAHVYVNISNFARLAAETDGYYAKDDYKRLIQGVHIYQRAVTHIVEGFGGLFVHFQGPKLHALYYRPIENSKELAAHAVLLQLVIKDFVQNVFNPAFPHYQNFAIAGGADLGSVIGTSNGINGDRELLFLGAPANYAAKIIDTAGHLRLTQRIYDALSNDLKRICADVGGGLYQVIPIKSADLDALLKAHGLIWRRDVSARNIEDDKRRFPLKDIAYSSAEVPIDLDALSITNNKRVLATSIFADVSGFTKYIDAAQSAPEKITALRVLHAVRKELARVIKYDFGGLRIQYQGDRVQGLFHLPQDNEAAIAKKAVETAVGLQSSMEQTLKACLPEASTLRLAVGVDMGITLVSKLGARGQRDRICLGEAVEDAARYEEHCTGGQIGVSKRIHDALPDCLRNHFTYSIAAQCFVATDLTVDKVERTTQGVQRYQGGGPVYIQTGAAGVRISSQELPNARSVIPPRPHASEA